MYSVEKLKENWQEVIKSVEDAAVACGRRPEEIKTIAVSKTFPLEYIERAMQAGIKVFGENYAQEFRDKHALLEQKGKVDPEWHYIGHLQRNKVKYLIPHVKAIHSVDSLKLAKEIAKQARKHGITQEVFLQVNTSGEDSKFGCDPREIFKLCSDVKEISELNVTGLMTIGSLTGDDRIIRSEFQLLRSIREEITEKLPDVDLRNLSMGMSGDFPIAIEEGATHIRIGTAIFGERDYSK